MPKKVVVIIGLGLMGGSLALALKRQSKSFHVFGISRSDEKIRRAIAAKIIDQGSTRFKDIPGNTDLIVIATPVPEIVPAALAIEKTVRSPVLVTDVGSTKSCILGKIKKARLRKVKFVGSHPMAGDHETGLESARGNLYENALVFIARDQASPASLKKIEAFWRAVGANRLVTLAAKDHDRIVGEVSHLPHLIASILSLVVRPEHMVLSGPGFRDTTRIAQGDPDLWTGIISSNEHLPDLLSGFEKQLRKISSLVKKKQWTRLQSLLSEACRRRRNL